jgi:hypothetical protein
MGVERLDAILLGQLGEHGPRLPQRVVALGEHLHEAARALEESRELVDAQLPR